MYKDLVGLERRIQTLPTDRAQTGTQQILFKHKEKTPTTFFSVRMNAEQVSQIDCGVFILGETQNPTGHSLLPAQQKAGLVHLQRSLLPQLS